MPRHRLPRMTTGRCPNSEKLNFWSRYMAGDSHTYSGISRELNCRRAGVLFFFRECPLQPFQCR